MFSHLSTGKNWIFPTFSLATINNGVKNLHKFLVDMF